MGEIRYETSIFFTCFEEKIALEVIAELRKTFKVLSEERSDVIRELYHVLIDGKHPEIEELLEGKTLWHKVDVLEFR